MANILIVIVTFNGATSIQRVLDACCGNPVQKSSRVLVVDNGSADDTLRILQRCRLPDMLVLPLNCNLGVARAYNIALEKAASLDAKWMFLLDQDSTLGQDCLPHLATAATEMETMGESLGGVFPTVRSRSFPTVVHAPYAWTGNGLRSMAVPQSLRLGRRVSIDSSISSGAFYSVSALQAIGGFRDDYFIDFVDHDCHLRLRRANYGLWWETGAELYHQLGRIQKMTTDGLWIEHAPYRYYYMARNMIDGHRRFGGYKALMTLSRDMWYHMALIRRYGQHPLKTHLFIFMGIVHACLGHFGPLRSVL